MEMFNGNISMTKLYLTSFLKVGAMRKGIKNG